MLNSLDANVLSMEDIERLKEFLGELIHDNVPGSICEAFMEVRNILDKMYDANLTGPLSTGWRTNHIYEQRIR